VDAGIHEALPENSVKVARRVRATPRICPGCSGRGFTQTPISDQWVKRLVEEHNEALEVAQELVDAFATSDLGDGPAYLSDPVLLKLNMQFERVLDRARAAGRRPAERGRLA
jgi:hypothetical protein